MYHYNYEMLVSNKQKEIETVSNEAWKYAEFRRYSLFTKIVKKFTSNKSYKKENISSNLICEC